MSDFYIFTTKNSQEEHKIKAQFKEIGNISGAIFTSLTRDKRYEIPFDVDSSILETFIQYLNGENKTPEIKIHELTQYIQLAEHFKLDSFQEYLNNKKELWSPYEQVLSQLLNPTSSINYYLCEQISQRLDDYLINIGDKLLTAPIQCLYNIFFNPKRILKNEDVAYRMITDYFSRTKKSEILILIPSLHFENLHEDTIKDSILNKEYHEGMIPEINFKFILNSYAKQDEQEKKITELTENFNKLIDIANKQKDQINQLLESNKSLKDQIDAHKKKYKLLRDELNQFKQGQIDAQERNNKLLRDELNQFKQGQIKLTNPGQFGSISQVLAINKNENALEFHEYECLDICDIKNALPNGTDLNAITNPGSYWIYNGETTRNRPISITNNSFRLVVKQLNNECIEQSIITTIPNRHFTRVCVTSRGQWTDWIIFSSSVVATQK